MIRSQILGIPLNSQAARRWFVAGFWLVEAAALAILFQCPIPPAVAGLSGFLPLLALLAFANNLPLLLGGFSVGGAVSFYEGRPMQLKPETWTRLEANPARSGRVRRFLSVMRPVDEREAQLRDWAHHRAHRLLFWLMYLGAAVYLVVSAISLSLLARFGFALLDLLLIASLSLPQTLLLWTLPELEPRIGEAQ